MPRPRRITTIRLSDEHRTELEGLVRDVEGTGQSASQGDVVAVLMERARPIETQEQIEALAADVRGIRVRIRNQG